VFAAASLKQALEKASQESRPAPAPQLAFNFAGSNTLAQQIIRAPRADVFISASEEWMDRVAAEGRVASGTRRSLLGNRLVLVAHREGLGKDAPEEQDGASEAAVCSWLARPFTHFVLADPAAVPAGQYAKAWLTAVHCGERSAWGLVEARILSMPDVRAALTQLEAQPRTLGVVYRTDARSSQSIRVLHEVTGALAPSITYPAAVLSGAAHAEAARAYLDGLSSPAARRIFESYGFLVPTPAAAAAGDTERGVPAP
jgi:molybdate transport system substrate-binding protein